MKFLALALALFSGTAWAGGGGAVGGACATSGSYSYDANGPTLLLSSGKWEVGPSTWTNGYEVWARIGQPTAALGLEYFDYNTGTLMMSFDGVNFVQISTGTGGATFNGGTVANQTTDQSSHTIQNNLGISSNFGVAQPPGASTMSVNGWFFFISSDSVVGSTSTANGTAITYFSTFTFAAGDIRVGDQVEIECMFKNDGTAPSGEVQEIAANYNNGLGLQNRVQDFFTTADTAILLRMVVTQFGSTKVWEMPFSCNMTGTSGGSTCDSTTAMASGGSNNLYPYNNANAASFYCAAQRTGGGNISFVYMKVRKS